jgi:hypothetical protein
MDSGARAALRSFEDIVSTADRNASSSSVLDVALRLACLASALLLGCGGRLVESHLSDPVVTPDGVVWWAEHRANSRGYNDTRVIMCQRGSRPVCVRVRPAEGRAR